MTEKTKEEILAESNIRPLANPDDYNYPNSAVDDIRNRAYVAGYQKAIADNSQPTEYLM